METSSFPLERECKNAEKKLGDISRSEKWKYPEDAGDGADLTRKCRSGAFLVSRTQPAVHGVCARLAGAVEFIPRRGGCHGDRRQTALSALR